MVFIFFVKKLFHHYVYRKQFIIMFETKKINLNLISSHKKNK